MSAVELIAAALAAGAGAGLKDTTSTAVHDAYAGLKRLLRPWMRDEARLALDADETESEVWQLRLRVDLTKSGAVDDDAVLAAARRLLALADLERARTFNINVDANHGAIGEFHAPVTFNQSLQEAPVPPNTAGSPVGPRTSGDPPGPESVPVGTAYGPAGVFNAPVTVLNNYLSGRMRVSWPRLIGVLPMLADCRQHRPADDALRAAIAAGESIVICQVITGLGGVGKTQVAAGLAHRLWSANELDLLVWISATSRARVVNGYAQAAAAVTGIDLADTEDAARRFLEWLSEPHGRRWLLVLDNLNDPNDLNGLWPPLANAGHTVVTTRRRDAALLDGRQVVNVGPFTPDEARRYLRDKLAPHPERLDAVDELAVDLDFLPLALAQAATYLADQGLTCAEYRRRSAHRRLARLAPQVLPDDYQAPVARTWLLSIDLANGLEPAGVARPTMEIAALLDANSIPITIFTSAAALGHFATRLDRVVDSTDARDAVQLLHRFSLATVDDATATMRVHGLVQRAVREATIAEDRFGGAGAATHALAELLSGSGCDPEDPESWLAYRTLLPHIMAVVGNISSDTLTGCDSPTFRHLLLKVCRFLYASGQYETGRDLAVLLPHRWIGALGPEDEDVLTARNRLGALLTGLGEHESARLIFSSVLKVQRHALGHDHQETLKTANNLGVALGGLGKYREAAELLEDTLTRRRKSARGDSPQTLRTANNLGEMLNCLLAFVQASEILEATHNGRREVLGENHPDTLWTAKNLATSLRGLNDNESAHRLLRDAFDRYQETLGWDHPDTLQTAVDLADSFETLGELYASRRLLESALDKQVEVLGAEHADTKATANRLRRRLPETGAHAG